MIRISQLRSGTQQARLQQRCISTSQQDRDLRSEAISAYRGLLRAATYLPDSLARKHAFVRIKSRFRADKERGALRGQKTKRDMTIQRLVKARRSRKLLEGAGDGDMDALKKVFLKVHGREGERKRWLIKYLLEPDEEALPKDASALQMFIDGEPPGIVKGMPDPKLMSFIKSQHANQPVDAHNGKIRQFNAKIPKENIWGRPTPISMQKKHVHKWWVMTLEKLLPPIPRAEWERLRDMATGVLPLEARPIRRTVLKSPGEEPTHEERSVELLDYFQKPARPAPVAAVEVIRYPQSKTFKFAEERTAYLTADSPHMIKQAEKLYRRETKLDLARKQTVDEAEWKEIEPTTRLRPIELSDSDSTERTELRARSLRRLYATIWSLTPTMSYDAVFKKWDIEWGGQRSRALEGAISTPTLAEEEMFEGLGTLPRNLKTSGIDSKERKNSEEQKPRKSAHERKEAFMKKNRMHTPEEEAAEQKRDATMRKLKDCSNPRLPRSLQKTGRGVLRLRDGLFRLQMYGCM